MKYGGVLKRIVAYVIDTILVIGIYAILGCLFGLCPSLFPMIGIWFFGSLFLSVWLYFALFESSFRSATPGKRALGLKVVDLKGKRISFLRATGRYFSRWILPIGVILMPFTKKKQALHDLIASTVVICKR